MKKTSETRRFVGFKSNLLLLRTKAFLLMLKKIKTLKTKNRPTYSENKNFRDHCQLTGK